MDLYALGATLAEALTGVPAATSGDGVQAGASANHAPELPESPVGSVIERLLADDPAARGSTADVLVALATAAGELRPWPEWLNRYAAVRTLTEAGS
jgi:serine/threonine protein kinase